MGEALGPVAVVAAALAIYGRATVPAAAKASELRSSERRVKPAMTVSFPILPVFSLSILADIRQIPAISSRGSRPNL